MSKLYKIVYLGPGLDTLPSLAKKCIMLLMLLLSFQCAFSQGKKITGTVTDEKGMSMPGVSVKVKGTSVTAITNSKGNYTIALPANTSTLVFIYVGYGNQERNPGTASTLDIQMTPSSSDLDDVIVVGYASKSKKDVGGAVISVDKRMFRARPVTNTLNALQGAAPGLVVTRSNGQPGREGWSARIRGITSLGSGNAPLFIIDGVEGNINSLNPNDIESVTVLEDAASAAIYGAKAGGGVILVTTKTGKFNQKTTVDFTSMYTFRTPYARPKTLTSRQEAELQNAAAVNGGGAPAFSQQQLEWLDDPNMDAYLNPVTNVWEYYYNNNMQEILMRKQSPQRDINLSISGGGDKSAYLLSVGYMDQQGVFKFGPDNYKRFNSRMNYTTKFSDVFSLDANLSFAKEKINVPATELAGNTALMYNIYSIRATRNPIFLPFSNDGKYAFLGTISTAYPILKEGGYDEEDRYNMNSMIRLTAKDLVKGLDIKAVYAPGLQLSDRTVLAKTVQRYTLNPVTKAAVLATPLNQVNFVNKTRPYTINQNFYTTADYDYQVDKHSFNLLGGFEYKMYDYDYITARQNSLLLNDFATLNYSTAPTAAVTNVGDNIQINSWVSAFSKLSYNFNSKYYLEGTYRRDGSSRLAPGHKFQDFYSVNAFWRMAQEKWFSNALPWVNEFKVAASYGSVGGAQTADQNVNNYDYQSLLSTTNYPFNDTFTKGFVQTGLPADSKAWEIIKTANFGFDLEVLNNRLRIHYDYFIKKNDNVFVAQTLPALLGVAPNQANLAAVEVKGWGLTLNWSDQFKNGGYFISANLSDDKNKVVKNTGSNTYGRGINGALIGHSTNTIYGYRADGYFNTAEERAANPVRNANTKVGDIKLVDVNGDGFINEGQNTESNHGDLVALGNTNSRYVFGISAGVNWKGFDLSVLFNGVGKRNVLINSTSALAFYDGGWQMPWAIHQDYWTPTNTNAKFPRILVGDRINDAVSSHWVQDASYIRLKNLQVGYTLKPAVHKVKGMGDIRLYFSGQDLWEKTGMWFNYYDPENNDNISFGYPLWRSYAFGLNINF